MDPAEPGRMRLRALRLIAALQARADTHDDVHATIHWQKTSAGRGKLVLDGYFREFQKLQWSI